MLDIGAGESGERQAEAIRKLTGDGFDLGGDGGGKTVRDARAEVAPRARAKRKRPVTTVCTST